MYNYNNKLVSDINAENDNNDNNNIRGWHKNEAVCLL